MNRCGTHLCTVLCTIAISLTVATMAKAYAQPVQESPAEEADPGDPAPVEPAAAEPAAAEPAAAEPAVAEPAAAVGEYAAPTEAVVAPVPASAPAPDAKPSLLLNASFFTRYEVREGFAELGKMAGRFAESDMVRYRARFGLSTTPIDIGPGKQVVLSFAPQASGFWADKGGTLTDGALGIHTATMRLQGDSYWLDTGRFEMAYGEHLVIGSVGWHETARTFDGARLHTSIGDKGAYVDTFVTQVAEDPTLVKPFGAGDQYFGGVYAGLGPHLGTDMDLDGYVLGQLFPKVGGMAPADTGLELTFGTRLKKKIDTIDVRAEAGIQVGAGSIDMLAYQADAEVGVSLADGKARLAAGGWYASGDDPDTADTNEAWDQLYPTAHKFMGFADIVGGRSNVMGGIARVKYKADPKLALGADMHLFLRPQTPDGVDAYSGIELDTWGMHPIGKGLGLRGGYSLFVPNESGPFGTSDVAHYVEVQLKYALK